MRGGDILVSSANSWNLIGKCSWVPSLNCDATFGGFVSVLRSDPSQADPRYLYRWFSSDSIQAKLRSFGRQTTNISNLDLQRCLAMQLPLPDLAEQQRIAAILDEADALRAKRRAALVQLDEMARAIFVEMFGAGPYKKAIRLSDCVQEFRYGTSEKSSPEGKPALRIPNIIGSGVDLSDLKLVPVNDAEFRRLSLRGGDILFVRTNGNPEYVGRCAAVPHDLGAVLGLHPADFVYASYLIRARLNPTKLKSAFLCAFLGMQAGREAIREHAKTSAGQFNINAEGLGALRVPLVDPAAQADFGEAIEGLNVVRDSHLQQLAALDTLFASLQHRAFRGEL